MKTNGKIIIVDYGVGNLYSLIKAFQCFADNVQIIDEPAAFASASALVLPGDGAFKAGMEGLAVRSLTGLVKEFARSGRPILGICLGAQILLEKGFEFGEHQGLGLVQGEVAKFSELKNQEKIPQIGWNAIQEPSPGVWQDTILQNVTNGANVYFVHSYILEPQNNKNVLAVSSYGGHEFCSVVKQANIYGVQFHPEKSGEVGLQIIKNFVQLCQNN